MSLLSSFRSLLATLAADADFRRLGARPGWYFMLHYRGRFAQRNRRPPPGSHVQLQVKGRPLKLKLTTAHTGALLGVFLDDEYDCAAKVRQPPRTVLDLGANIGMGTLYLATLFPQAEFLCVEPDPRNLTLLRENLSANGVSAQVHEGAVAAQAGKLNLRFNDDPTCSALESSPMHATLDTLPVDVTTVPELLKSHAWERIDLLKIDIEGSEDELLSKNNGWLDRVGGILMEIHPNTTPERIAAYLKPFGFTLERNAHGREPVYFASRPTASGHVDETPGHR